MHQDTPRVLLVEDDPALARVYAQYLRDESLDVEISTCGQDALKALRNALFSVILLDLHLPDISGFDVLADVHANCPIIPVVVITAQGSIEKAVRAMKGGASDFVLKPVNKRRLIATLQHALERSQLVQTVKTIDHDYDAGMFCGFVGASAQMQEVYRLIEKAAPSKATVFVTGESGTGKEVAAQALHDLSPRAKKPFVALNCGAIPKDLMESEIFGHIKGAFTGALENRDGAARMAHGGTLFLDEVCEMDPALQVKLLRFIQTDTFRKIGGKELETVDVRFICATNRDPWYEVQSGRFREDLFYRLHVIPLHLPPLSARGDDVLALAHHFLKKFSREEQKTFGELSHDVEAIFRRYGWPGNVREVQNVIRHVVVLFDGKAVKRSMLPPALKSVGRDGMSGTGNVIPYARSDRKADHHADAGAMEPGGASDTPDVRNMADASEITERLADSEIKPLWQMERDLIQSALDRYDGNVQRAAVALELSPSTLYRRIRELREA